MAAEPRMVLWTSVLGERPSSYEHAVFVYKCLRVLADWELIPKRYGDGNRIAPPADQHARLRALVRAGVAVLDFEEVDIGPGRFLTLRLRA